MLNTQNRAVKTYEEIQQIKNASTIVDNCFGHILDQIEEGMTEIDLAFMIEEYCFKYADGVSFETIVAFGKNAAEPHHSPNHTKLANNTLIKMDFGALYKGYCSDFTRTVEFGTVNDELRKIYSIVEQAEDRALAMVAVGASCAELFNSTMSFIESFGYGKYFIHGLGHGVGREIHETPTLNGKSAEILEKNMVVTVEPGIYIPNVCGVRIEDMIVVGEKGRLSRWRTELIKV